MLGCGGCCDNTHRYSYSGERLDALKEDFLLLLDVGVVGGARKTPGSGRSDVFALYPSRCFENYIRMGFARVYCSSIVCLFIRERTKYEEVRSFSFFPAQRDKHPMSSVTSFSFVTSARLTPVSRRKRCFYQQHVGGEILSRGGGGGGGGAELRGGSNVIRRCKENNDLERDAIAGTSGRERRREDDDDDDDEILGTRTTNDDHRSRRRRSVMLSSVTTMLLGMNATKNKIAFAEDFDAERPPSDGGGDRGESSTAMVVAEEEERVPPPPPPEKPVKIKKKTTRERIEELERLEEQQLEREEAIQEQNREIQQQDSTIDGLQRQLELKNELIALLKRERDEAKEAAKLAQGLCAQSAAIF